MTTRMDPTLIAFGSNLPAPDGSCPLMTCQAALVALRGVQGLRFVSVSRWYRTEPIPRRPGQPDFCNGVARFETGIDPERLLTELHDVERRFGRTRSTPNAARTIDLDLIAIGPLVRNATAPIMPHPRMHERRFVLEPLCDVAADWIHPILGQSAASLRNSVAAADSQRIALWSD